MPVSDYNPPERVPVRASRGHLRSLGLRSLAILALLMLANTAQAQITNPNVFFYEPDPPQADRAFLLNVRVNPCLHGTVLMAEDAWDRELVVLPGRIEITMLYVPIYVCAPGLNPYVQPIHIDPVPAGTYELIVYGRNFFYPDDPDFITQRYATSVTVVPLSHAINGPVLVPSSSRTASIVLGGLLLLFGALFWRRSVGAS